MLLRTLGLGLALGLLAIAVPLEGVSPAGEASAYCIQTVASDDCVNPCTTAARAVRTATGGRATIICLA